MESPAPVVDHIWVTFVDLKDLGHIFNVYNTFNLGTSQTGQSRVENILRLRGNKQQCEGHMIKILQT